MTRTSSFTALLIGAGIVLAGCSSSLPVVPTSSSNNDDQLAACKRIVLVEARMGQKMNEAYDDMRLAATAAGKEDWDTASDYARSGFQAKADAEQLAKDAGTADADTCTSS